MTTQAADIQHVISKNQAVEQMYQTQKQQPDNNQQQFAATVQQKMYEKEHQAQSLAETEQGKVLKDKQDKLSLSMKSKKDKNKEQKKKKSASDNRNDMFEDNVGQIIDLKI